MSTPFEPSPANIQRAVDCLVRGELIGLPTETVYGLAARGDDPNAVAKIFAAKGRPSNNPLILHVGSVAAAERWMNLGTSTVLRERFERAASFWPGPVTLIGPKDPSIPDAVTAGGDTVAIRIPSHRVALEVLRLTEFPVAAPSANRSNYISPTLAQHVVDGLGDEVSMVLDGGPCAVGLESTIVSLGDESSPPQVLRLGSLGADEISDRMGQPVNVSVPRVEAGEGAKVASPGQFRRHYSPRTPLVICDTPEATVIRDAPEAALISDAPEATGHPADFRVLRITMGQFSGKRSVHGDVISLSPTPRSQDSGPQVPDHPAVDLEVVAARLYETLRRADAGGYDRIEVEACDESTSLGRAIMDRLRRAATPNDSDA